MKTMKKMVLTSLALSVLSTSVWAAPAAETTKEISAQTTITRGKIDNLLEKVNRRQLDSRFNAQDYQDQSQAYKNKVESALTKFESVLDKDILSKAGYWVDQYNAIYNSKDYSADQKKMLLDQRKLNITNQFQKISGDYQKAIRDVYDVVPYATSPFRVVATPAYGSSNPSVSMSEDVKVDLFVDDKTKVTAKFSASVEDVGINNYDRKSLIFKTNKKTFIDDSTIKGLSIDYSKKAKHNFYYFKIDYTEVAKSVGMIEELNSNLYNKVIYPAVKGSCKSSICVGLRASDYASLVIMIKSLIDRDMVITLADGSKLVIAKVDLDISTITQLLSIVNYPEELPFDI